MDQLRVVSIAGTRPEIIKMSRVMACLDKYFDHRWIHTGQNWSPNLREVFLRELEIRDPDVQGGVNSSSPAAQVGEMLSFVDSNLARMSPDAVVVLGDTNSALTVYAARRRGIAVFHLEAGNRGFNDRTPEELNRRLIDHMSSVNMPYTEHARMNLLREGVRPDRVFVVGSPQREVIEHYRSQIVAFSAADRRGLTRGKYILASLHREENVDDDLRRQNLLHGLERCAREFSVDVLLVVHPRLEQHLSRSVLGGGIHAIPSPGFFEYLSLSLTALCVVSDSGTISEEAAVLGFPAVMMRRWHERPEGMDVGVAAMADASSLEYAIRQVIQVRAVHQVSPVMAYEPIDVSLRVANIVRSYTDVVKDDVRCLL